MAAAAMTTLLTYRNTAWTHIINCHEAAKLIETAQVGRFYTLVSDNIDYYIIERVAKPVFSAIVDQLRQHPFLYAIGMVSLLIFVAHPTTKSTNSIVTDLKEDPSKKHNSSANGIVKSITTTTTTAGTTTTTDQEPN